VDRGTVARHIRLSRGAGTDSKPAIAPIGSPEGSEAAVSSDGRFDAGPVEGSKPANAPIGSEPEKCGFGPAGASGRRSECERLRELIAGKLDQGLSAQRIYQDLVVDHGFAGSYYSVRRFVRRLSGGPTPLPFRRIEKEPGEEAQVDFGVGAPIVSPAAVGSATAGKRTGKRSRPHVFRIVLSHSRKGYSEAVHRQTTDEFLQAIENALWHFGGAPRVLVIDNLRAAVSKADWFDPEISPKVQSFCQHYGMTILPTKPYTPRHKGKIERGIGYVKDNGLKGKTFESLEAENEYLAKWEAGVADKRIHGTTRRQVGKVFEEVERPRLQPLPAERFPFFHEARRTVHRDGHVEVCKAYYSVPPEYVGRVVWVRWDARTVRIYSSRMEQIALHLRQEPGRFSTLPVHLADEKISAVERGAAGMLVKAERIGDQTARWAQAMIRARGIEGLRVLLGLLSLADKHPPSAIEKACSTAHSYGAYRLRTLRQLLDRQEPADEQLRFLDEHPIIRRMSDYGDLVRSSFHKETSP
jgi:transposase